MYKDLNFVSNKNQQKVQKTFDSYGLALDKVLNEKGLSKTWLAEKIYIKGEKPSFDSIRSMISRWTSGETVSFKYQMKINRLFDLEIKPAEHDRWEILRTENRKGAQVTNNEFNVSALDLAKEERSRLDISELPDTELGRAAQDALAEASTSFLKLRRLIRLIEKETDDD